MANQAGGEIDAVQICHLFCSFLQYGGYCGTFFCRNDEQQFSDSNLGVFRRRHSHGFGNLSGQFNPWPVLTDCWANIEHELLDWFGVLALNLLCFNFKRFKRTTMADASAWLREIVHIKNIQRQGKKWLCLYCFNTTDVCWYVWHCQVEKTYPLPPVLSGVFHFIFWVLPTIKICYTFTVVNDY